MPRLGRRAVLLVCSLVFICGCRDTVTERLHGVWVASVTPGRTFLMYSDVSKSGATAGSQTQRSACSVRLEFRGRGQVNMRVSLPGEEAIHETGTWRIIESLDPIMRLGLEVVRDGQRLQRQLEIEFGTDPSQFSATEINGDHRVGEVVFHRQADLESM